jgi:membrane protein YdbS with pleckstrin-like domain
MDVSIIENFDQVLSIISIIGTLLLVFESLINSFDATEVEKKLMTNSKRLSIFATKILTLSIILSIVVVIQASSDGKMSNDNRINIASFLALTLLIFMVYFVIMGIFKFYISMYAVRYNFLIDMSEHGKWYLRRRINKKQLLLMIDNRHLVINYEDINKKPITMEKIPYSIRYKNINKWSIKNTMISLALFLLMFIIGAIVLFFVKNPIYAVSYFTLAVLFLAFSVFIITIKLLIKREKSYK